MASANKWMQQAFSRNKGALHRQLGIPENKTIPMSTLLRAAKSKNKLLKKRAIAAMIARRIASKRKKS